MPTKKVTITLEADGRVEPGFPITREYSYDDEAVYSFTEENQDTLGVTTLRIFPHHAASIGSKGGYLTGDQELTLRFNNGAQSEDGDCWITLNANGFVLCMGASLENTYPALYLNTAGATNTIKGFLLG